jgi:hypothetical protein
MVVRASPAPLAVGGIWRAASGGSARLLGAGAGEAVFVLEPVGEGQRAAEVRLRRLGQLDRRRAGRRDREDELGGLGLAPQNRRAAVAADRPAALGGRIFVGFWVDWADETLDAGVDDAGLAADDQRRILEHRQRLGFARLHLDHDWRTAGVRGRIDPGVDPASRRRRDRVGAAPVEGGGEPAVEFRARRDRGRERHERDGEAQRVRIALGHVRGGRRDADFFDRAGEARLMRGPQRPGDRILVIGERVGERSRGPVVLPRVAIETGRDVAVRGPAEASEGDERSENREGKQRDAGDPHALRRYEPDAEPRQAEEQRNNRER